MTIVFLEKWVMYNEPPTRSAKIYISNNGEAYISTVGGFSTEGSLQAILNAQEAALFTSAQAGGILPTSKEKATAEAILWYKANPLTKQIFTLDPTSLEAEVGTLVNSLFPGIAAATRNQKKKVWTAELMAIRVAVAGELEDLGV